MQEVSSIYEAPHCAEYTTGLKRLHLKHPGLNPTGSFRRQWHDSWSNAGPLDEFSDGGLRQHQILPLQWQLAARAGMKAVIFIPDQQIAFEKAFRRAWTTAP